MGGRNGSWVHGKWIGGSLALLFSGLSHAGTHHYYYTDPQGTVLAKADANGNIIATYDYTPYGTAVTSMNPAPNGPGYTGHVNDPDTGLMYMQARYYDPTVGRFLSIDPVGPAAGEIGYFNRYSYVGNNPTSRIDPFGLYYCKTKGGCQDFDKAYAKLKDAAGAYSSHSAEGKAFSAVLGYYGNSGSKNSGGNSVFIKEGTTSTGNPAEIVHNSFTGADKITFDFKQISEIGSQPTIEMAAIVGHEGQHGVDDAARRKVGISESQDTVRATEHNAYRLQSFIYQGLNYNSPYGLWRSNWPANEAETRRDAAIEKYSDLSVKSWLSK
jgi:RHS repeat-associated protein